MHTSAQRPPRLLPFILAGIAMIGPFSIDAIFPGFPDLKREFDASPVMMQQVVSLYLLGFAAMSLFHGPLSDALGRKRIVIVSTLIFVGASVGVAISHSLELLLVWRFIQGCSAGGGVVVGRAIIRDVASGPQAQKMISTVMMIFGVAPAIAPVAGAFLLNLGGWRATFWAVALFAFLLVVFCQFCLAESLPRERRQTLAVRSLLATYFRIASDFGFVGLALASALNFGALFLYISSAPRFIFDFLHLSKDDFAWFFVPVVSGIIIGSWCSGMAANRIRGQRLLWIGYGIVGTAIATNLLASFVFPSSRGLVIPLAAQAFGISLIQPILTLLALDRFPNHRGAAASVQAFLSLLVNTIVSGLLSPFLSGTPLMLAIGMLSINLLGFVLWFAQQSTDHAPGDIELLQGAPKN